MAQFSRKDASSYKDSEHNTSFLHIATGGIDNGSDHIVLIVVTIQWAKDFPLEKPLFLRRRRGPHRPTKEDFRFAATAAPHRPTKADFPLFNVGVRFIARTKANIPLCSAGGHRIVRSKADIPLCSAGGHCIVRSKADIPLCIDGGHRIVRTKADIPLCNAARPEKLHHTVEKCQAGSSR